MAITVQEAQVIFSADGLNQVQTKAGQAGKALDRTTTAAGGLISKLKGMGGVAAKAIGVFGGLGVGAAAVGIVKMATDAETLSTQMKVLTGDAGTAAKVIEQINTFAAETPFQQMEIGEAARKLLAFNGSAATVVDELRMLGDIAAATGQPIGELSELYGKAKVQGRLFGEDINQLTGRGIPIISALAREFGVAESEVKSLVEKGAVGFPEMQRALAGMTGPGGQFAGMMAEMSETTAGKFSTFVDNVKMLGTELGEQVLPYANDFLTWATKAVSYTDGIGTAFGSALGAVGEWFTTTRDYLSDVGVVAGVVVADMGTLWAGLFQDIPTYAKAAFDWISANSSVIMANIAASAENMWARMEQKSRQLGEWIAYQTGMSDEILDIPAAQMKPMAQMTTFQAPALSEETTSVLSNIDAELAESRKQRASEAMAARDAQKTEIAAAENVPDFVSREKTKSGTSTSSGAADRASKSQSFSAEALFASLRESALSKQIGLQTQSVNLQSQAVEIAEAQLDATKKINMGLA
jgi:tape measure domain-containing protein